MDTVYNSFAARDMYRERARWAIIRIAIGLFVSTALFLSFHHILGQGAPFLAAFLTFVTRLGMSVGHFLRRLSLNRGMMPDYREQEKVYFVETISWIHSLTLGVLSITPLFLVAFGGGAPAHYALPIAFIGFGFVGGLFHQTNAYAKRER